MNFSRICNKVFKFIILITIGFILYVLISQYVKIQKKREQLNQINQNISAEKTESEKIKREIEQNENLDSDNSETTIFENVIE